MPLGQPGFFTVDSTGKITFNFAGHVSALGLDFPVGLDNAPTNDSKVRWNRANGGVVAEIYGVEISPLEANLQHIVRPTAAEAGRVILNVVGSVGNNRGADLQVSRTSFDSTTEVLATARGNAGTSFQCKIIDAMGRSSFLQNLSATALKVAIGSAVVTMPAGVTGVNFDLESGWANSHDLILCTIIPVSHYGFGMINPGEALTNSTARVVVNNVNVAHTVTVKYVSFGS